MRQFCYITLVYFLREEWKSSIEKIIEGRKLRFKNFATTTQFYCKTEFSLSLAFNSTSVFFLAVVCFGGIFTDNPDHTLPLPYYILGLPVDANFPVNFIINFAYQVVSLWIQSAFFFAYIPMTAISINHLCWFCDLSLESIKELGNILGTERVGLIVKNDFKKIEEIMKKTINAVCDVIEWQEQAQKLLKFSFLVELSLLSIFICVNVTSITTTMYHIVAMYSSLLIFISQIFVYCWLGSRVKTRYESLARSLFGLNWQQLHSQQRKDIQLILLMCQNLREFHGVFKAVDLTTFQKVSFVFKKFGLYLF